MIDAYATYPHLIDHIAPVWHALDTPGRFYVGARRLVAYANARGIAASPGHPDPRGPAVLVANHRDLDHLPPGRRGIFMEHGAGQHYTDVPAHPSYPGGTRRQKAALFLALNDTTARLDRAGTPDARVIIVGSPRLDTLHDGWLAFPPPRPRSARPVVAVCWHWDCGLVPETRWAWPYYRQAVIALREHFTVLGHGHPRAWPLLSRAYELHGIEPVETFAEVVARADVVVVDNTSAGPEAAACGLPVVWANAPWYRREVTHGGRFWAWPRWQPTCDTPAELAGAVVDALCDDPRAATAREVMVNTIYPAWTRGRSAALAAAACATVDAE